MAGGVNNAQVLELLNRAACVDADPNLMVSPNLIDLITARQYCLSCPVWKLCYDVVQPDALFFDGTASGRSWHDGRDISDYVERLMPYVVYFEFHQRKARVLEVIQAADGRYPIDWLSKDSKMLLAYTARVQRVDTGKTAKWLDVPVAMIPVIEAAVELSITPRLKARTRKIPFC